MEMTSGFLATTGTSMPDAPHMSHVLRKPVFGVCDQLRLKSACSADETSLGLEISAIASRGIKLYRQRTTKALIRRRLICAFVVRILHKQVSS